MRTQLKSVLLLITVVIPTLLSAQSIDKAFRELALYNFYSARQIFTRNIDKKPLECSFGLALLYSGQNPFHHIDTAHSFILACDTLQQFSKPRKNIFRQAVKIDSISVLLLHHKIDSLAWAEFRRRMDYDLASLQDFINKYSHYSRINEAIVIRDSMAFAEAKNINSIGSYSDFMGRYPEATQFNEALEKMNRLLFTKFALKNNIESYTYFIQHYPNHPFRPAAEDSLYQLFVADGSLMSYVRFVRHYPDNRNAPTAWQYIYDYETYDLSPGCFERFLTKYPDYPLLKIAENELRLSREKLYPYSDSGLWGFIDSTGLILVKPQFQWVGEFHEGLADFGLNDKTGFIRKNSQIVIPAIYEDALPFSNGQSIVFNEGKAGIIDKRGELLLPFDYDDLGNFSGGVALFEKNGKFGYLNKMLNEIIPPLFDEGYACSQGTMLVKNDSLYGFINPSGDTIISFLFNSATPFADSISIVEQNGSFGIIDLKGRYLLQAEYDKISKPKNRIVIAVKDDKIRYYSLQERQFILTEYEYYVSVFEEGRFKYSIAKATSGEKFGIIDQAGKWVVKPVYKDLKILDTSHYAVWKGSWYIRDLKSGLLSKQDYFNIFPFKENLCRVVRNGRTGFLDKTGKEIIPVEYDKAGDFKNGFSISVKNNHYGLIDSQGHVALPFIYKEIAREDDRVFRLQLDDKLFYWNSTNGSFFP